MGPSFSRLRTLASLAIGVCLLLVCFYEYQSDSLSNNWSDLIFDGVLLAVGLLFLFNFARRLYFSLRDTPAEKSVNVRAESEVRSISRHDIAA